MKFPDKFILLFLATMFLIGGLPLIARAQDEYTTIYDWGDEDSNTYRYETYEFETDTWKRGFIYDRTEPDEGMWEDSPQAQQYEQDIQKTLDWFKNHAEGYSDVYR